MNNDQLPFQLHLSGHDLRNGDRIQPFNEVHHYPTKASALTALLKLDTQYFQEDIARRNQASRFYTEAKINTNGGKDLLFFIMTIAFRDSPEGFPPAGIYLERSEEVDWRSLKKEYSISFENFPHYDPDCLYVLLAPMTYEDKLVLVPTDALTSLQANLGANPMFELKVLHQTILTHSPRGHADVPCLDVFHFDNGADAMAYLMKQDIRAAAKLHHANPHGLPQIESVIKALSLQSAAGDKLLSVETFNNLDSKEDNGIYLCAYKEIFQHVTLASIIPAALLGGTDQFVYRKIFHYGAEGDYIFPDRNFYLLAQQSHSENMYTVLEKYYQPYNCTLRAELIVPGSSTSGAPHDVFSKQCGFFEHAVKALLDLCRQCESGQLLNPGDQRVFRCSILDSLDDKPIVIVQQIRNRKDIGIGYKLLVNEGKIFPCEVVPLMFHFDGLVRDSGIRLELGVLQAPESDQSLTANASKLNRFRRGGCN